MDPNTGKLYSDPEKAPPAVRDRLVQLEGKRKDVEYISRAVKAKRRAEKKRAKQSRKKNR